MNWLKDLVDVPVSVEELSDLFALHSMEVEEFYSLVEGNKLVVGYVTEMEKHPNADKLNVCQVDIGGEISQIVCGAPNVNKGQHVIVSLPGAVLPGGFKIKSSTIRDVKSDGMICSLSELGIDKKYHNEDGIHVITSDVKPGQNALEALYLDDQVMALDLTPNRADLLSMMGVAYDTAAILNTQVKERDITVVESKEDNPVSIELDTEFCSSYLARVIDNIEIKASPKWMQSRLIAAGMRPINNVVDITNYVMLETGQPLHAFDYDLLQTGKIVVRMAKDKEVLVTLDNIERHLTQDDIVITNGEKAVALGGVMGGLDTEIVDGSKRILLESAIFDPYHIRKTSNRLDLRSEASTRFERKVDPNRTILALELATKLFIEYASGTALKGVASVDRSDKEEKEIHVTASKISQVLGIELSSETISETLGRLNFSFELEGEQFTIYAPTRRQDIETYQDIIEEVGRIIGYNTLPLSLPETISIGSLSEEQSFRRNVRHTLTGLGLNEVVTYSLVQEQKLHDFSKEKTDPVALLMPMSSDRSVLAKSPLTGILEALKYNVARKMTDVSMFEVGKRYDADKETKLLSGAMTGLLSSNLWKGKKEVIDFYTVKGILESLFQVIGTSHLEFVASDSLQNLHPGQQAIIKDFNHEVGYLGKLHPQYAKTNGLKEVYVFELNMDLLFKIRRPLKKAKEINKFPTMQRDIAIVLDKDIPASNVLQVIKKAGKRMLLDANVFDLYLGENVGENEKSLAIRMEFSDPKRTLEAKEVDDRVASILKDLEKELSAKLR
jgi:phenylalanyl-tRNA synthetase beta chain